MGLRSDPSTVGHLEALTLGVEVGGMGGAAPSPRVSQVK